MRSLKERTEIQQEYLDGKQIEFINLSSGNQRWGACTNEPLFEWHKKDYRIKREPMEIWVMEFEAGTKMIVEDGYVAPQPGVIKKYIEVID